MIERKAVIDLLKRKSVDKEKLSKLNFLDTMIIILFPIAITDDGAIWDKTLLISTNESTGKVGNSQS